MVQSVQLQQLEADCIYDDGNLFGFCQPEQENQYYSVRDMAENGLRIRYEFWSSLTPFHLDDDDEQHGTTCYKADGSHKIDDFVRDAIYSTQYNPNLFIKRDLPRLQVQQDVRHCINLLANRLCSLIFKKFNSSEENTVCNICKEIYESCHSAIYPVEYHDLQIFPEDEMECLRGTINRSSSSSTVLSTSTIAEFNGDSTTIAAMVSNSNNCTLFDNSIIPYLYTYNPDYWESSSPPSFIPPTTILSATTTTFALFSLFIFSLL